MSSKRNPKASATRSNETFNSAPSPSSTDGGGIAREAEIIQHLGSSQGNVSVVAALLAGFGYTVLESGKDLALRRASVISVLFLASSVLVVAGNVFVAILCAIYEQQSKIAVGMSLLRDSHSYNLELEAWWRSFAGYRTNSLWIFFFSVPLLFVSLVLGMLLNIDLETDEYFASLSLFQPFTSRSFHSSMMLFGGGIFATVGVALFGSILYINQKFRQEVLRIAGLFHAPRIDSSSAQKVY